MHEKRAGTSLVFSLFKHSVRPAAPISRNRNLALNQMNEVSVTICEKHEPVALVLIRRPGEHDAFAPEVFERRVKVLDRNRDVPESRRFRARIGNLSFGGNNFDKTTVFRPYKIISLILVAVAKPKCPDVPLGKRFGIG
jgi:hypothetical protein